MNYFEKRQYTPRIGATPSNKLSICVVIPSYNEPNIYSSLEALANCQPTQGHVEVIVVINHPENSPDDSVALSENTYAQVVEAGRNLTKPWLTFHAIKAYCLPKKQAGVGLARQIGMDEAAYRFFTLNKPNGIVDCFDADSLCASNYLYEIEKLWDDHPKTTGCSIRYNHPISGIEYSPETYRGIAAYELHLRYYNQASRHINFPFAFHTIGSSMACTAETYTKIGGMNRRQAGEDFYFLQKIIPNGNFRELNSTCVYPSPRASDRVPFGTGRAMGNFLGNTACGITTYDLQSFLDLTPFFDAISTFYNASKAQIDEQIAQQAPAIKNFLAKNNATSEIIDTRHNTGNPKAFNKRFFTWFDAFKLLKYLNFANETQYKRNSVLAESVKLLELKGITPNNPDDVFELLNIYRRLDL